MKIVKVKVRRGSTNEDQMVYPSRYNAAEVDRKGFGPTMLYGVGGYSGGIGRGEDYEFCLIQLEDALADEYATDNDMEIIDPADADILLEQWRTDNGESEYIVDDSSMVEAAKAMQAAGITLPEEIAKAIDPEDDTVAGIRKRIRPIAKKMSEKGAILLDKAGDQIAADGSKVDAEK